MGQPHSTVFATTSSGFTGISTDGILTELDETIHYEKSLGNGQFMKTIRCRHPQEGTIVVKLFIKPDASLDVHRQVRQALSYHRTLKQLPNVLSYPITVETDNAVYLARQYIYASLYDRISTRPFLQPIEKKWITFQLLCGVRDIHQLGICHGDIKCENILVSSWNWAYLCDFAPHKPVFLPEDNPANFSYFFDASARRLCYIAPERFVASGPHQPDTETFTLDTEAILSQSVLKRRGRLTPAMDIFSLGCVIAELFLEGKPLFTLSQLLQYRSGEHSPQTDLTTIGDEAIRALVQHMIQPNPADRFTAAEYLAQWRDQAFPSVFYSFLHPYMAGFATFLAALNAPPSATPANAAMDYPVPEPAADPSIDLAALYFSVFGNPQSHSTDPTGANSNAPMALPTLIHCCSDARIDRLYHDWPMIRTAMRLPTLDTIRTTSVGSSPTQPDTEANLILVSLVTSCLRNAAFPTSRRHALELLYWLSVGVADEHILDRMVPYALSMTTDATAIVRQMAVYILTQLLARLDTVDAINADLFVDYVLPGIRALSQDPDLLVRIALASSVAVLAETSARFLEISSSCLAPKSSTDYVSNTLINVETASSSEQQVERLRDQFQAIITLLLTDQSAAVKRALLVDMTRLALFFGHKRAHDFLLSHIITYLNDRDWQLRGAFFEAIVGLATVVGPYGLEMYLMPLMTQSLTDTNEFVVEKVLHGFTALTETGLFAKPLLWDLLNFILPLVLHPNTWIRAETMALVAAITQQLPLVDKWCVVLPALKPYLKVETLEVTVSALTEALKAPISRRLFHEVLTKPRTTLSATNSHSSAKANRDVDNTGSESPPLGPRLYRRNSSTNSLGKSPPMPALSQLAAEQTGMLADGPTNKSSSARWDYLRHADPSDYAKLDALAFYLDKLKTSMDHQQRSSAARHKPNTAEQANLGLTRGADESRQFTMGAIELTDQSEKGEILPGEFNSLGATPHTVFLTPSDAERPEFPAHPALTLDSERANRYFQPYYSTLTSPTLSRGRRGLHRVASDTHLRANVQELQRSVSAQPGLATASAVARARNLGGQPGDASVHLALAVPTTDHAKRRSFSVSGATPTSLPQRSATGLTPTLIAGQTLFVSPPLSPSSSVLSLTSIAALSQRKVGASTVPKAQPSITVTESQVVASSNDPSRSSPTDGPNDSDAASMAAALDHPQTLRRLTQTLERSTASHATNGLPSPSRGFKSAEWWQPFLPRQPLAHRHLLLQHSRFADTPSTKSRHVLSGTAGENYFDTHFPSLTRSSRAATFKDLKHTSQSTVQSFSTLTLSTPTSALHWLIHYDSSQTVKTLLRKKALEVFPRHLPELGPATDASLLSQHRRVTQEAIPSLQSWRPEGMLVAYFKEHTGAINALSLSSDQGFFATASDDHTVKVWDCVRLGQHVLHRARATYRLNVRVQSVTFLHHTYSLAATGDDGSVHILRFDPRQDPDTTTSTSGCRLIRKTSLPLAHEYAVRVVHSHTEHRSQLIVATTESRIYGLDIRALNILWTLVNPVRYGLISAFVCDPRHTWLLVGTVRGVLTLWDLRFQVLIKAWQHPSQARIYDLRFCVNPASRGRWVWMATSHNEISVWDVEQARCLQVFCGTRSWDDLKHEIMRHQYQALTPPTANEALHGFGSAADELSATFDFHRAPDGMRERTTSGTAWSSRTRTTSNASQVSHQGSVAAALATTSPSGAAAAPGHAGIDAAVRTLAHPAHGKFVLAAGTDRKIRYWDLECIDHSYVVSGSARGATGSVRTRYHTHQLQGASTTIFTESPAPDTDAKGNHPPYGTRKVAAADKYDQPTPANFGMPLTAAQTSRKVGRHHHHRERLALFASHEDCITVLGLTEVPYPMIISGARDGVIRVYM